MTPSSSPRSPLPGHAGAAAPRSSPRLSASADEVPSAEYRVPRFSTVGSPLARLSTLGIRHPASGTRHSALSTQHSKEPPMRDERIPVAVLGATGSVGQRFVQLLAAHPWFRPAELVASERSAGKRYREATDWRLDAFMPEEAADLVVQDYNAPLDSPLAVSALPAEVAGEIEQRLA